MRLAEFWVSRLVEVYDAEYPWARDDDFFIDAVGSDGPLRVLDLGCGTGRLAIALAAAGHRVTGIDPAPPMLAAARHKDHTRSVTWMLGSAGDAPAGSFDVALMTSHVAQFVLSDEEWTETLSHIHAALMPGGRLIFDTRDPSARAWEHWTPTGWRRAVRLRDGLDVIIWTDVQAVADVGTGDVVVEYSHHYEFADGDSLTSEAALRFRSETHVRTTLEEAGFRVDGVFGGWQREPVGHSDGELLVIATRQTGAIGVDPPVS